MNECTFSESWKIIPASLATCFHLVKSMYSVLNTFVEIILALTVKPLNGSFGRTEKKKVNWFSKDKFLSQN